MPETVVFVQIPLASVGVTGGAAAMARDAAGVYNLNLSAASTTYQLHVPISAYIREKLSGGGGAGTKLKDLVISYAPTVANLTAAPTVAFFRETIPEAVARAVGAAPLGAVTYEAPIGTVAASLPVAFQTGPTVMLGGRAIPATPVYSDGTRELLGAEIDIRTGAGATCRIGLIGVHLAISLN
jgi:hypothetical protein